MLKAKPPKGMQLTSSMMDNAVSIVRQRVDKLGTREPVITKQGTDEIDVELPAIHDPAQAAKIIGSDRAARAVRPTPSLYGPSIDASQNPVPSANLFNLLVARADGQKGQRPSAYYLFKSRDKKLIAGPEQSLKALKNDPVVLSAQARQAEDRHHEDEGVEGPPGEDDDPHRPARQDDPRLPDRLPGAHRAGKRRRSSPATRRPPPSARALEHDEPDAAAGRHLLLPLQARRLPVRLEQPVPADDGQGPGARGHAGRHRPEHGPADRHDPVQGQGQRALPRDHPAARRSAARSSASSQSFAIVLDNQLYSFPTIDYKQYGDGIDPTGGGAADHRPRVAEGGERPRARPPDRRPARPVRHGLAHRRLGDARQGLAPPGAERRDRRPDPRRALPARALPVPRRRRGRRPRDLLGADVRRDPPPRRHADAAGLRGPDPDDRRRRGRERRHLRTNQGRGARREIRARRDRPRLREGLPHDHRRERRHGDHGADPVRGRDRRRSRDSR